MERPAARVNDIHICPLVNPSGTPHVGGPILPPSAPTVKINDQPAARVGDHAFCVGAPPDTIRGGLITVFICGSPSSRLLDPTDAGKIFAGSPNVLLGEWAGGPLTPYQAQWLYDYLASETNIPYEFATDGCFARADRMARYILDLGIPVQKQWVRATGASGPLQVPITNYPGGGVTWGWHVAPLVQVAGSSGTSGMVLDPSLNCGGPVSVTDWVSRQSSNPSATVTSPTNANVYFRGWDRSTETWDSSRDVSSDPARTQMDLDHYRTQRANLPASSGRRIPNAPVHF